MLDIFVRYLHFIGIVVLAASLLAEFWLVEARVSRPVFDKLGRIDSFYGIGALVTLVAGLTLWWGVGKPAVFYTDNPVFIAKVCIFVVMGALSVLPTVFFIKQRNSTGDSIDIPMRILMLIRIQVVLLFCVPLLAVLMARGVGL
ncbi:MAG: DUF2214 family protein [Pseudomonadota bacterium]